MDNENTGTPLDKILPLLGKELSLALRLYEQAETQRKALKEHLNGKAVAEATEAINATLRELAAYEKEKTALLAELGAETLEEAVGRLPYSKEKTRARQQMQRLNSLLQKLKDVGEASHGLLNHAMEYLTFSLNVMTAAAASPAYGTPDAPQQSTTQGRKLLDTSV